MFEADINIDSDTSGAQHNTRPKRHHDNDLEDKPKKLIVTQDTLSILNISESDSDSESDCLQTIKTITKSKSSEQINKLTLKQPKKLTPAKMATKKTMEQINSQNVELKNKMININSENGELKNKMLTVNSENSELKNKVTSVEAELAALKAQMKALRQHKTVETAPQATAQQNTEAQQPFVNPNRFQGLEINDNYTTINMEEDKDTTPFTTVKTTIGKKNKTTPLQPQQNKQTATSSAAKTTNKMPQIQLNNQQIDPTKGSTKTTRPPPIHIHTQQISDTITLMKGSKITNFTIKRVSQMKHTLQMEKMEDYKTAKQVLNEVFTPYFTYTPKGEKPKTVVLKGLHENEDLNEIKSLIEEHNIKVINVTQLKTKHSKNNEQKLPLYIIQYAPDTNMGNVFQIKSLNYQRITWEPLKKSDAIMQCHQCQRFGHAAANCNLKYRCVKCKDDHEPGQCQIIEKIDKDAVYCINCQTTGHPASYKGCPYYQATLQRLQDKIKQKREQTHIPAAIPITKKTYVNEANGSFADMLKGGKQQQQQPQASTSTSSTQQPAPTIITQLTQKIDVLAETVRQQGEQLATLLTLISELAK